MLETPLPSISLIPFLDMLNHDPSAEVKLFFDTSDMRFKIITAIPLERGQQVFISYGKHDNWRLLVEYGFIVEPKSSRLIQGNNTSSPDSILEYEPTDKFRRLTPIIIDSWIRTILLSDLKSHCSNHPSSSRRSSCLDLFLTYSKLTLLSESGYMSDYTFHSTPSYRCFMALALLLFPYFNGTPEMADMSRRLENVQNTDAFRAVQSKVEQIIKRWGGSESIILNNGDDNWTRTKPVDSEMVAISHTSSSGVQKELKASSLLKSLNSWFFNHEFTVLWKNSISGRIPAFNNLQSQSGKAQESVRLHLERVKNWIKNSTKVVLDARKQYSNFYKQLHPEINSGHWNWKVDDVAVSHFSFTQSLKSNVLDVVSDVSDLAEVVSHNINPYLLHCVDVIWSSELQVLEGIVSGDWDYDDLI
ncbi:hypothetical protein BKA69DRAFT_295503 [Paraphysoderma sedebokerense]|nr:hypothetical protein BKA69DRAFT_295503 [Paraphysoderma sedebokerense]